jgi:hypothetical protein
MQQGGDIKPPRCTIPRGKLQCRLGSMQAAGLLNNGLVSTGPDYACRAHLQFAEMVLDAPTTLKRPGDVAGPAAFQLPGTEYAEEVAMAADRVSGPGGAQCASTAAEHAPCHIDMVAMPSCLVGCISVTPCMFTNPM